MSLYSGALGVEATRQSISNLAVKLYCGENTSGGALREHNSVPDIHDVLYIICTTCVSTKYIVFRKEIDCHINELYLISYYS
jgi:hypothetical protein